MIVYAEAASTLGYPCATSKGRCAESCEQSGDPLDLWLDGEWMGDHRPTRWPRCPVVTTYDDPHLRLVLSVRRQHALGGVVDLDAYAAWVSDLWAQLEALRQEKLEKERAA